MPHAVHHLDCGTMCPHAGRLTGGDSWLRPGRLVCHVLLIETDRDGLVLVDTGFGAAQCATPATVPRMFRALVRPALDPAQTARAQVERLGYRRADVRHIVVTHLDLDHAGGIADFPEAQVHIHRPEYLAAMTPRTLAERTRYLPPQWAHQPRWVTYAAGGETWFGLPAVRTLEGVRDDVVLVPLVGHTRGHSGVAVKDGDRWLLHAGDAFFHRDELHPGRRAPIALHLMATADEHDRKARLASLGVLRDLSRRPDVAVVCSHDPVQLDAMASSDAAPSLRRRSS